jgi:hypothetical protein
MHGIALLGTIYSTWRQRSSLVVRRGIYKLNLAFGVTTKHLLRTPGYIWKEALQAGSYNIPKFCIYTLTMHFAGRLANFS